MKHLTLKLAVISNHTYAKNMHASQPKLFILDQKLPEKVSRTNRAGYTPPFRVGTDLV